MGFEVVVAVNIGITEQCCWL